DNVNNTSAGLKVFNITDLTGSTDAPYKSPVSTQSWQKITGLQIIKVPGVTNHFVIASTSNAAVDEKPILYVGEIDANTGRILKAKSITLDITGIVSGAPWYPISDVLPGSNLQSATVGSSAYVFMNQSFKRFGPLSATPGTLKIAAYKFNPADLSLTSKGDISFE